MEVQSPITLNRTIPPVVVGLVCWVYVEGYPWWPARIVDRKSYEANLELDDDDPPLAGETDTNMMVEFFDKEKLCGIYGKLSVVEYVSNMHLVQQYGHSRDELVQACREAHQFVMTDGLYEQRQRLETLDPLDDLLNKKLKNFFGTLELDVLSRIALWLSYRPCADDWASCVQGADLENCLMLSGEFQSIFKKMLTPRRGEFLDEVGDVFSSVRHEHYTETGRTIRGLESESSGNKRVDTAWSSYSSLEVQLDDFEQGDAMRLCNELVNHGNVVEQLHIRYTGSFYRKYIEYVTPVSLEMMMYKMLSHCPHLRQLDIENNLPFILDDAWKVIGSSLEVLRVFKRVSTSVLLQIKEYCRSLNHIYIGKPQCERSFIDLILSYGVRMKLANIKSPTLDIARELTSECPNLRFIASLRSGVKLDSIAVLGPRIEKLVIKNRPNWDEDKLNSVLAHCSDVSRLTIAYPSDFDGEYHDYLIKSKPRLEQLQVHCRTMNSASFFSSLVGSVELKLVEIICYPPPLSAFRNFMDSNTKMERLTMVIKEGDENSDGSEYLYLSEDSEMFSYVAALISTMRHSKNLRHVNIRTPLDDNEEVYDAIPAIKDSCVAYRHQPIFIEVNDHVYLPAGYMHDSVPLTQEDSYSDTGSNSSAYTFDD